MLRRIKRAEGNENSECGKATMPFLQSSIAYKASNSKLIRLFRREKDQNLGGSLFSDKIKIGVIGLSACAGTTLFTFSLARYIANLKRGIPAFVEISSGDEGVFGWNYDRIGIDKRFADREFVSHYKHVAKGKSVSRLKNLDEGINWVLRLPLEHQLSLDVQQMTSLINNAAGDIVVCDFSSRLRFGGAGDGGRPDCCDDYSDSLKRLLREMSVLFLTVNPAPSRLIGGAQLLSLIKGLEVDGIKVMYVLNMFGKGINKRELLDFLKPRDHISVPVLSTVELLEAEYNCKNPFQMAGVKEAMTGAIEAALRRLG